MHCPWTAWWSSTADLQQERFQFESQLGPFCVEFACSPSTCVGSLGALRLPLTVEKQSQKHVKVTGDSALNLEVIVSVHG